MLSTLALLASLSLGVDSAALQPRLDDGVAETPPMGSVYSSHLWYSLTDIQQMEQLQSLLLFT